MTNENEEILHIEMSPEAIQIGLAQFLSQEFIISGHDEIDPRAILDCMAVAGCHLEHGGEISSKAYFMLLKIEEMIP